MTESAPENAAPELSPSEMHRLHPLTPFLRSWRMLGAALAIGFGFFKDDLQRLRFFWEALHGDAELSVIFKAAVVLFIVAAVLVTGAWLSWRATGFAIVDDAQGPGTLRFHRGLFVRQRSQIRLNRVQSVDVNQPLFARALGLAVLRLDMAAGDDASVSLAYLSLKEAWSVREEIIRHTANAPELGAVVGENREDQLVARVSTARLVQASLLESMGMLVFFVLWIVAVVVIGVMGSGQAQLAGLSGILPVTIAILVQLRKLVGSILRDADFRLYRTPTGIRVSAGLTSTVNRTIDTDRIQGVRLEEPFLWRRLGWARVEVDVAGAADSTQAARLMPVADRPAALDLVRSVTGVDLDAGDVRRAGQRANSLDPVGWRYLGVVLHEHGAVSLRGRWRRSRAYVPYARAQSVSVRQGLVQRRLGLASASLDLPKGIDSWQARHRDVAEAADLVAELSGRARAHRLPQQHSLVSEGSQEVWGT